jgi:hypothetical protein
VTSLRIVSCLVMVLGLSACATATELRPGPPLTANQAIECAREFLLTIGERRSRIHPITVRGKDKWPCGEIWNLESPVGDVDVVARWNHVRLFSRKHDCTGREKPTYDLAALERRARAMIKTIYPGFDARRFTLQPVRDARCTSEFEYVAGLQPGEVSMYTDNITIGLRFDSGVVVSFRRSTLPFRRTTPVKITEQEARRTVEARYCGKRDSIHQAHLEEMPIANGTRSMTVWSVEVHHRKGNPGSDIFVTYGETYRIDADTGQEVDVEGAPVRRASPR